MTNKYYDMSSKHIKMLNATFGDAEGRQADCREPLWHVIDVRVDCQARDTQHLLMDAEQMYVAIEDYLKCTGLSDNVPPLYASLFEAKAGFMTQAKFPTCIRTPWMDRFDAPVQPRDLTDCSIVLDFRRFLGVPTEDPNKNWLYDRVLSDMEEFGFPVEEDSEDESYSERMQAAPQTKPNGVQIAGVRSGNIQKQAA